jgi:O-antigen/teichoic acid export membrane protein
MTFLNIATLYKYSLNLGIRGATIGLKFLFALFLGKYFPEEVLGEYGLLSTTILLSYLLLSLSFDSYAVREIVEKPREHQLSYIRNVFVYFAIAYSAFTLIAVSFSTNELFTNDLFIYFAILLFFETVIQIQFSLFTVLRLPTVANLLLFLSQGSWILIAFLFWFVDRSSIISLPHILLIWIGGSLIACIYGLFHLHSIYGQFSLESINWKWIRSGLPISFLFFAAAFGYKGIEYADRYFIEFKLGTVQLGVYVFYSQIANLMNAIINVTVVLMLYPRLIETFIKQEFSSYLAIKRKMYQRILLIGVTVSAVATIFIKIALVYIGKESFYEHINVFYILLISNIAMNLSFVSHYCLYAMRRDTALVFTTLAGTVLSIILNFYLIDLFGIEGAAIATCSSFLLIWVFKSFYVHHAEKRKWK